MLKWIGLAVIVLILITGIVAVRDIVIVVRPGEAAVITRFGQVIDVRQPGRSKKIPFIQSVAYIGTDHLRVVPVDLTGALEDGSKCNVRVTIVYRVIDPRKAYEWRMTHGMDVSGRPLVGGRADYAEPKRVFEQALLDVLSKTTPQDAANGALEKWMRTQFWRTHREANLDGTSVSVHNVDFVECSKQALVVPSTPAKAEIEFGAPKSFASRPAKAAQTGLINTASFTLPLRLRDSRQVRFENLVIQFAIVDANKFKAKFSEEATAQDKSGHHIKTRVEANLRRVVGNLDADDLPDFDPAAPFLGADTKFAKRLNEWGVVFIDIVTDATVYRLETKRAD